MRISILIAFLLIKIPVSLFAQEFPLVKGFGGVHQIPFASEMPDKNLPYKIVVDIKMSASETEVNEALNNLARLMNLHALGGVKKMDVVAVLHAGSAKSVLNDGAYKKRYQINNPNTEIIEALTKAGANIFICGQSMKARNFLPEELNQNVKVALSALTLLTTYQAKGYSLIVFQ